MLKFKGTKQKKKVTNNKIKIGKISFLLFLTILLGSLSLVNQKATNVDAAGTLSVEKVFAGIPSGSSSTVSGNRVTVVPNVDGAKGAVWSKNKVDFGYSWKLDSTMLLGGNTTSADGITISFQSNSNQRMAGRNGLLNAYGTATPNSTNKHIISIEFDTWNNDGSYGDFCTYDHTGKEMHLMHVINTDAPNTPTTSCYGGWANEKGFAPITNTTALTAPINVIVEWTSDRSNGGTLKVTAEKIGTLSFTMTAAEVRAAFGGDKLAYLGYTGANASGNAKGLYYAEFNNFEYTGYDVTSTVTMKHPDGSEVTDANPAIKYEKLHVVEVLKNPKQEGFDFNILYKLSNFVNLGTMDASSFKVNSVAKTYADNMPLVLPGTGQITIEYDILVQSTQTFTDATGPQKVGMTTTVTSPLGLDDTFVTTKATKNAIPTISATDQIIAVNSTNNLQTYLTNGNVTSSDLDTKAPDVVTNSANFTSVVTTKPGIYNIIFTATDPQGVSASVTKKVVVTPNGTSDVDAQKPYIYAVDRAVLKGTAVNIMDNVYAYDRQEGDMTSQISTVIVGPNNESTFNSNIVGTWTITFNVRDGDLNRGTKTIKINVVDQASGDIGHSAKSFELDVAEVATLDQNKVITKGEASAFQLSTGNRLAVTANFSAVQSKAGVYDVTYTASGVNFTVKAIVKDADTTVNNTNDVMIYGKDFVSDKGVALTNASIQTKSGSFAKKLSTGENVTLSYDTTGIDINKADVYPLKMTTANGAEHTVSVTIKDTDTTVDDANKTMIYAKSFVVDKGTALTNDDIITRAAAFAKSTTDGSILNLSVNRGTLDTNVASVYQVTFTTTTGASQTIAVIVKDVSISVGTNYVFQSYDYTIRRGLVDAYAASTAGILEHAQVKLWNIKTGELVGNSTVSVRMQSTSIYTVNAMWGAYPFIYTTTLENGFISVSSANVIGGSSPVFQGATYKEIAVNEQFIPKAGVSLSDVEDTDLNIDSAKVTITNNVDNTKPGVYKVIYEVTDTDLNKVTVTRVVVVKDDTIVVGNSYIVIADDYSIRKSLVVAGAVTDAKIRESAGVKLYNKTSGNEISAAGVKVEKLIPKYEAGVAVGNYPIKLTSYSEPTVQKTIYVNVFAGAKPTINVSGYTEVVKGTTSFDLKEGITVTDDFDTLTSADVTHTGNFDINKTGVYQIEYSVTDSDGNIGTAKRVVVVTGDEIAVGNQYIIYAEDYSIRKGQAKLDVQFENNTITSNAKVVVYNKADGSVSTTATVSVEAPTFVKNVGLGNYDATYKVDQEPTVTVSQTISVVEGRKPTIDATGFVSFTAGNHYDPLEGVTATDHEDGDFLSSEITVIGEVNNTQPGVYKISYQVTDSDDNITTVDSRVVAVARTGELVIGENYIIQVLAYDIRVGQVTDAAVTDASVKEGLNVRVYDKHTGDLIPNAATTLTKGTGAAEYKKGVDAGEYPLTISVDLEPTLTVDSKVNVLAGTAPTINGATLLQLTTGSAFDSKAGITVTDDFDTLTAADVTVVGNVTTTTPGVYPLRYTVVDSDRNSTTVTRVVVVADENKSVVGDRYILLAQPYQIRISLVNDQAVTDTTIKSSATVKVYDKVTGIYLPNEAVSVNRGNGSEEYKKGVPLGTYPLTYKVVAEPTTLINSTVEVTAGQKPTITGADYIEIDKDSIFDIRKDVIGRDAEDGVITSEIRTTGTVTTNIPGVYKIKYTLTDNDDNTTIVNRVVVVKDVNSVGIGDKYIIKAETYQLRISEVTTTAITDNAIRNSSRLVVYDKATGNVVPNPQLEITRGTGAQEYKLGVLDGDYPITYSLTNDNATLGINVRVIKGEAPRIDGATFKEISTNGTFNPLEGVSVYDLESENNSIPLTDPTFKVEGTVNTAVPGVYKVVYTVKDVDFNEATVTRVVVVSEPGKVVVGTNYIIKSSEYEIRKGQVNAAAVANDEIFSSTEAAVYDKETGDLVEIPQLDLTKGTGDQEYKVGVGLGSYPLTISTGLEAGLTVDTQVTVISGESPVFVGSNFISVEKNSDYDLINHGNITDAEDITIPNTNAIITGDTVDYTTVGVYKVTFTVTDSDGNSSSVDRVVAVTNPGELVVGDNYIIKAKDYEIRKGQVNAGAVSSNTIITSGEVIVYDKATGNVNNNVTKTVTKGTGTQEYKVGVDLGDYPLTYSIEEEPTLQVENKVTVIAAQKPTFEGLTYLEVAVGETVDLNNGVSVTDDFDTNLTFTTNPVTINTATGGVHRVSYTTTDSDGNITTEYRVVVVKDASVIVGTNFIIKANDYTLRRGQVTSTAIELQTIKDSAEVMVYNKTTGNKVIDPVINVVKDAAYLVKPPVGEYTMVFKYPAETGLEITRKAIVISGDSPVIENIGSTSVAKGATFDPKAGVTVTDDFDTLTAANVTVEGTVDTQVPGIYKLTYKVKDSDLNETIVQRVVVVTNPGEIVAGTDYIIKAQSYEIRKGQVTTQTVGNDTIITSAQVKVFSMATGDEITNPNITVTKGTGAQEYKVGVNVGDYPLTYGVTQEPTLALVSKVKVINGASPEFKGEKFIEVTKGDILFKLYEANENQDLEDGNLAEDKVVITKGNFDVNVPGVYQVGYKLTDSDGNITEITRTIAVSSPGELIVGTKYIIEAKDYTIYRGKVIDSAVTDDVIKTSALVKVYSLEAATLGNDVTATTNVLVEKKNPKYVAGVDIGTYDVTYKVEAEQTLKIDNQIYVIKGDSPTISNTTFIEVTKGSDFDPKAGITARDTEDTTLSIDDVEVIGDFDSSIPGVYKLTYKVTDSDRNTTQVVRVVAVSDPGSLVVGNEYIIKANDYSIRKGLVTASEVTDETIIRKSGVVVYDKGTGNTVFMPPITINKGNPEYKLGANYGLHPVTSSFNIEPTLRITTNIDVLAGAAAQLHGVDYKEISISTPFNPKEGVTVTDDVDTITVDDVEITGTVDVNKPGVYPVKYKVTDSDGNITEKTRVVVVTKDDLVAVGNTHIIVAKSYEIRLSEVDASDATLTTMSEVKVYDKATGELSPNQNVTFDKGNYNDESLKAIYPITVTPEADTTVNAKFNVSVVAGNLPVITYPAYTEITKGTAINLNAGVSATDDEDGPLTVTTTGTVNKDVPGVYQVQYTVTDSDSNEVIETRVVVVKDDTVAVGNTHIIVAKSYEIRLSEVDPSDTTMITKSEVKVYDKATGNLSTNQNVTFDKGNYNADSLKETYPITVSPEAEPTINANFNVKVVAGNIPEITYPPFTQVVAGGTIDLSAGVSAYDEEDKEMTPEIIGTVDMNKPGVYPIQYKVTDVDQNTVIETRVVVVTKDDLVAVGTNHIIVAESYEIRLSEVDSSDQELVTKSQVKVYDKATGALSTNQNVVFDKGTYNDESLKGTYPILVSPENETTLTAKFNVKVVVGSVPVITYPAYTEIDKGSAIDLNEGVSATDTEDGPLNVTVTGTVDKDKPGVYKIQYSVTDSDQNTITETRVVVVKDNTVGIAGNYIIVAESYEIRVGEVNDSDAKIIEKSKVKVYDKATGELSTDQSVTFNKGTYSNTSTKGLYNLTVSPSTESGAVARFDINVIEGNKPVLRYPAFTNIVKGGTIDIEAGVTGEDQEDGPLTVEVTGSVNPNEAGVYVITYKVTDSDRNIVTGKRVVVVDDGTLSNGDKYIIQAKSYVRRVGQVDESDPVVLAGAEVKVFDKLTGEQLTITNARSTRAATSVVIEFGTPTYANNVGVGVYPVKYSVADDVTTFKEATIEVIAGVKPTIEITSVNIVELDATFNKLNGVKANDEEDGDITAGITTTGNVNTKVTGIYPVVYKVTDSDGNETEVTRNVMVINPDTTVFNDKYIITANSYVIKKEELNINKLTLAKVLEDAKVKLYDRNTMEELDISLLLADLGKLHINSQVGPHKVTYSSKTNPSVSVIKLINIIDSNTVVGEKEEPNGEGVTISNTSTAITAKGFVIDDVKVKALTVDDIIKLASAQAWNMNNGDPVDFSVDYSALKNVMGTYPITFTTADGVKITIYVEVNQTAVTKLPNTGSNMNINQLITITLLSGMVLVTRRKYIK